MSLIPFDVETAQQYEKWYNVIIECSLQVGGSIIDNNGTCKKFDPKNKRITLHSYKQNKKQIRVKPWWDEICQEAVDFRRNCYKKFLKCPDKLHLNQYRKASHKTRNIIKVRKKINFNKFRRT